MTKQPVRVLHLFANLNLGGAESRIMDIYRNQSREQVINDFVIMTNEHCYFTNEVLSTGGVIHAIPNPRYGMIKNCLALYRLLKKHPRYNALHAHTSYYSGIAIFIAWLAGINKRVAHARNQATGNQGFTNRLKFWLGRMLANTFATSRLAISHAAGDFLFGEGKYKVVANAFDFSGICHKSDDSVAKLKMAHGINDNLLNLVVVARFYPIKNHQFLLPLLKQYVEKTPNICLHFIGDGELRESIELQVQKMQLANYVRFWGKRDDVKQLLAMFDVMIMPSLSEGLGVAALEAQAAGLSCVLSSGVPQEADIGLGMCQFLELSNPPERWLNAIDLAANQKIVAKSNLHQQFAQQGYTLSATQQAYLREYR